MTFVVYGLLALIVTNFMLVNSMNVDDSTKKKIDAVTEWSYGWLTKQFDGNKPLIENLYLLYQKTEGNLTINVTRRNFWNEILSSSFGDNDTAKNEALLRMINSRKVKEYGQPGNGWPNLDLKWSSTLKQILQTLRNQYISEKFNHISIEDLSDMEGRKLYTHLDDFKATFFDFVFNVANASKADIQMAFNIKPNDAEYIAMERPLSETMLVYDLSFKKSNTLWEFTDMFIKRVNVKSDDYIKQKLSFARMLGLVRNIGHFKSAVSSSNKTKVGDYQVLKMKLNETNFVFADGVNMKSIIQATGVNENDLKQLLINTLLNQRIEDEFNPYDIRTALSKFESKHFAKYTVGKVVQDLIAKIDWRPSKINESLSQLGMEPMNLTIFKVFSVLHNISEKTTDFIFSLSGDRIPKQKINVYRKVKLMHILSTKDTMNDSSVIDVLDKFGTRLEYYAHLPLIAIPEEHQEIQINEVMEKKIFQLSKALVGDVTDEVFVAWFDIAAQIKTYMESVTIKSIYNLVSGRISQRRFLLLSLSQLSNTDLVTKEPVQETFEKKIKDTVNTMFNKVPIEKLMKIFSGVSIDIRMMPFNRILSYWFLETQFTLESAFASFTPTTRIMTRLMNLDQLKQVGVKEKMSLKQINELLERRFKSEVQKMFLDVPIIHAEWLCDFNLITESLKAVFSKCLGISPFDLNHQFGTTEVLFNEFPNMTYSDLPNVDMIKYGNISLRQAVTFAKYGSKRDVNLFLMPLSNVIKNSSQFNETMPLSQYLPNNLDHPVDSERIGHMVSSWLGYENPSLESITIKEILNDSIFTKETFLTTPFGTLISLLKVPENVRMYAPRKYWSNKACYNASHSISKIIRDCRFGRESFPGSLGSLSKSFTLSSNKLVSSNFKTETMSLASSLIFLNFYGTNPFLYLNQHSTVLEQMSNPYLAENYTVGEVGTALNSFNHMKFVPSILDLSLDDKVTLKDLVDVNTTFISVKQMLLLDFPTLYALREGRLDKKQQRHALRKQMRRFTSFPILKLLKSFKMALNESTLDLSDSKGNKLVTIDDVFMEMFGTDQQTYLSIFNYSVSAKYLNTTKLMTLVRVTKLIQPSIPNEDLITIIPLHVLVQNFLNVDANFLLHLPMKMKSLLQDGKYQGKDVQPEVLHGLRTFLEKNYNDARVQVNYYTHTFLSYNFFTLQELDLFSALTLAHKGVLIFVPLFSLDIYRKKGAGEKTVKDLFKQTMEYELTEPGLKIGYGFSDEFIKKFGNTALNDLSKKKITNQGNIPTSPTQGCSEAGLFNCDSIGLGFYSWNDLIQFYSKKTHTLDASSVKQIYANLPISLAAPLFGIHTFRTTKVKVATVLKYVFNHSMKSNALDDIEIQDISWFLGTSAFVFDILTLAKFASLKPDHHITYTITKPLKFTMLDKETGIFDIFQKQFPNSLTKMELLFLLKKATSIRVKNVGYSDIKMLMGLKLKDLQNIQHYPVQYFKEGDRFLDTIVALLSEHSVGLRKVRVPISSLVMKYNPAVITMHKFIEEETSQNNGVSIFYVFDPKSEMRSVYKSLTMQHVFDCFGIEPEDTIAGILNKVNSQVRNVDSYIKEKVKKADSILPLRRFYKPMQWKRNTSSVEFCQRFIGIVKEHAEIIVKDSMKSDSFSKEDIIKFSNFIKFGEERMIKLLLSKVQGSLISNKILHEQLKAAIEGSMSNIQLQNVVLGVGGQRMLDSTFFHIMSYKTETSIPVVKFFFSLINYPKNLLNVMETLTLREVGYTHLTGSMAHNIHGILKMHERLKNLVVHLPPSFFIATTTPDYKYRQQMDLALNYQSIFEMLRQIVTKSFDDKLLKTWFNISVPESQSTPMEGVFAVQFSKYLPLESFRMLSLYDLLNSSLRIGSIHDVKERLEKRVRERLEFVLHNTPLQILFKLNNNFMNQRHLPFATVLAEYAKMHKFSWDSLKVDKNKMNSAFFAFRKFTFDQLTEYLSMNSSFTKNIDIIYERLGSKFKEITVDLPLRTVLMECNIKIGDQENLSELPFKCGGVDNSKSEALDSSSIALNSASSRPFSLSSITQLLEKRNSSVKSLTFRQMATILYAKRLNQNSDALFKQFGELLYVRRMNVFDLPKESIASLFTKYALDETKIGDIFAQWVGLPLDASTYTKSLKSLLGRAGVSIKDFLHITPVQLADVLKAQEKDKFILSKASYMANLCLDKAIFEPYTLDTNMSMHGIQTRCPQLSKFSSIMMKGLGSSLSFKESLDILSMSEIENDIDYYSLAKISYDADNKVKRLLLSASLRELATNANIRKLELLQMPFEDVPSKLLHISYAIFERYVKFDFDRRVSLGNLIKIYLESLEQRNEPSRLLILKFHDLFSPPALSKTHLVTSIKSFGEKSLQLLAKIFHLNGKDIMTTTVFGIYKELFGLNQTEVSNILVLNREAQIFASTVTLKDSIKMSSRLQQHQQLNTLTTILTPLLKNPNLDMVISGLTKIKDINNRADTVQDLLSVFPNSQQERFKAFVQMYYGEPFDHSTFLTSLLALHLSEIGAHMNLTMQEVRELSIFIVMDVYEKYWTQLQTMDQPLLMVMHAYSIPYENNPPMPFGKVMEMLLQNHGITMEDFAKEHNVNISQVRIKKSLMQPLSALYLGKTPKGKYSKYNPSLFSIKELISILTGRVNISSLDTIYSQRIAHIVNLPFLKVLPLFGIKHEDALRWPISYFADKLYDPYMVSHLGAAVQLQLRDVVSYFLDIKNAEKMSYSMILNLTGSEFIRSITKYIDFKNEAKDVISFLQQETSPHMDKASIYSKMKFAVEMRHETKLNAKQESKFFQTVTTVPAREFYKPSHGTLLQSTHKIMDIIDLLFLESMNPIIGLTGKISTMFITSDDRFKRRLNFPEKFFHQNLFDLIETYALIERDTVIKRFKLTESVIDTERTYPINLIQSCHSRSSSKDLTSEMTFRDLLMTLLEFRNPLQPSVVSYRKAFFKGYNSTLKYIKNIAYNANITNLQFCLTYNNYMGWAWNELRSDKFPEDLKKFGLQEASVTEWYLNKFRSFPDIEETQFEIAKLVMPTFEGIKVPVGTDSKLSAVQLIQKSLNVSSNVILQVHSFLGIQSEVQNVLEKVPLSKFKSNSTSSLLTIYHSIFAKARTLDALKNKSMAYLVGKKKGNWRLSLQQSAANLIANELKGDPELIQHLFPTKASSCFKKLKADTSLLELYASSCTKWFKRYTMKQFMFLPLADLMGAGSSKKIVDISINDLIASNMIGRASKKNVLENLMTLYTKSELSELAGISGIQGMHLVKSKTFTSRSMNTITKDGNVYGKLTMDIVLNLPFYSMIKFCGALENQTFNVIFKQCTGRNIDDLFDDHVFSVKSFFESRLATIKDVALKSNVSVNALKHYNIRKIATCFRFGSLCKFLMKSYAEFIQSQTSVNSELLGAMGLSWFGLNKFDPIQLKFTGNVQKLMQLTFDDVMTSLIVHQRKEHMLFVNMNVIAVICGEFNASNTLHDFFRSCNINLGQYGDFFVDVSVILRVRIGDVMATRIVNQSNLFDILMMLDNSMKNLEIPLMEIRENMKPLNTSGSIKMLANSIGIHDMLLNSYPGAQDRLLKDVVSDQHKLKFLTMKDVLKIATGGGEMDILSTRIQQLASDLKLKFPKNGNQSVTSFIKETFDIQGSQLIQMFKLSTNQLRFLNETSISDALKIVKRFIENENANQLTLHEMFTELLYSISNLNTYSLALKPPVVSNTRRKRRHAHGIETHKFENLTKLFADNNLTEVDLSSLVRVLATPNKLKIMEEIGLSMTDYIDEITKFSYREYIKKLQHTFEPENLIALFDDVMYQELLEIILKKTLSNYHRSKDETLDTYIRPTGSNKGVHQVLLANFHSSIIEIVKNKTVKDYIKEVENNMNTTIKTVIKRFALRAVTQSESGIIGSDMPNYLNYTELLTKSIRQILEMNYDSDFTDLQIAGSGLFSISVNGSDMLSVTSVGESVKPQSLLLLNWMELFQYGNDTTKRNMILRQRRKKMEENSVLEIFQIFQKNKNAKVPLSERIMYVSEEFFGESAASIKSKWSLSDVMYNQLKTTTFEDLKWLFQYATDEPLSVSQLVQNNTLMLNFYLKPFKLEGSSGSIVDGLTTGMSNIDRSNISSTLAKDLNRNSNNKMTQLLTEKPVNTFFEDLNMKYKNKRVLDVVQELITLNTKKCSYCKGIAPMLKCTTNTNATDLCMCFKGFQKKPGNASSPAATCEDINECKQSPCHSSATCINTIGSFVCDCPDGRSRNGLQCVDACATATCPANSRCTNIEEGSECVCNTFAASPRCNCHESTYYNNVTGQCQKVAKMLKVNGLRMNKQFDSKLTDRTSKAFNRLSKLLKRVMLPALKRNNPDVNDIEITKVRKGSIVVDFIVLLNDTQSTTTASSIRDAIMQANRTSELDELGVIAAPVVQDTDPCQIGSANCVENAVCVADSNEAKNYRCECTGDNEWDDKECIKDAATKRFLRIGLPIIIIILVLIVVSCVIYNRKGHHLNSSSYKSTPNSVSNPAYEK